MARDLPADIGDGGISYIRWRYGVPARRMGRVTYRGEPGTITDATGHLTIRLDTRPYKGSRLIVHPKDPDLIYLPREQEGGGDGA